MRAMLLRGLLFAALTILGVALSLSLGGCATFEERPIKVGTETRLVTLMRTYTATEECSKLATAPPGWGIAACATHGPYHCTIRMRPDATDDTLGHELRHCVDGDWHPIGGKK